uniref:DNA polymerase n=1 Tax=Macrostomum lignano TaxID=282301 RepID=A0A1I8IBB6_9PLAT
RQVLPFNEFKLHSLASVSESKQSAEPDEPPSKRPRSAAFVVEEADVDSSATASTSLASESASQSLRLPPRVGAWICAQSSLSTPAVSEVACPANADIVRILGQMADTYGSTNDKWLVYSYKKAAQAVKRCSKPIDSRASAQSLPGSGRLAKLDCLSSDETVAALKLFTSLWGAGPVTAQAWVAQGLRSLDDLASRPDLLNRQQKIGLKHYDDFLNRMPRSEAGEIESVVAEAVHQLGNGFIVQACGSYRRGRPDCGDVDVLVTHPDGRSHAGLLTRLVTHLERTGFLTDHLVSCEENGDH